MGQQAAVSFEVSHDRNAPQREDIRTLLRQCAKEAAPDELVERTGSVTICARGTRGEMIGGIYGDAFLGCMEIDRVWIAEQHRRGGLGTRLLAMMEDEAAKIGCTILYLSTLSFQAPLFYEKVGFERFGTLKLDDRGTEKILYSKVIEPAG